jgi:hypothetical protein
MPNLEAWLVGTPTEVDTAMAALRSVGQITGASHPEPLYGTDAGRIRRYLRVNVSATTAARRAA